MSANKVAAISRLDGPDAGSQAVILVGCDTHASRRRDHIPRYCRRADRARITCEKCGRSGQYRVDRLIVRYGIDAKLFEWSDEIAADCPRKHSGNLCARQIKLRKTDRCFDVERAKEMARRLSPAPAALENPARL
jgi:hypothetical protein